MKATFIQRVLVICLCFALAACMETMKQKGTAIGAVAGAVIGKAAEKYLPAEWNKKYSLVIGTALGAYIGGQIGAYLDKQDREKAVVTTQRTFETGQPQSWSSDEKRTRGSARVVASRTEQTSVAVPVLKKKVSQVPPLEILGATYKAKKASSVHGGPGTDYEKVGSLNADEAVNVVGKVKDSNWFLISQDGVGSGFVPSSLMEEAPDEAVASAGKPPANDVATQTVASDRVCRTVEQTVSLADGSTKTEKVEACRGVNGWEPKTA